MTLVGNAGPTGLPHARDRRLGIAAASAGETEGEAAELQALADLPKDQAQWPVDAVLISPEPTTDDMAAGVAVAPVITFWDHAYAAMQALDHLIRVDSAGSYCLPGAGR